MTSSRSKYDVVVIGLGAVGSATLFHLSKSSKSILGIDRYEPPHTFGSSHGESRITRLAVGEGEDYVALAKRSHQLWREIEEEAGVEIMSTTLGILLDSGAQPWAKHGSEGFWNRTVSFAKRQNVGHRILDHLELKTLFPAFQLGSSGKVYLEHEAGFLRPENAIRAQLDLAQKRGAQLLFNSPVKELSKLGDSILIRTGEREIVAGKVLLSAGGWIRDFLPEPERPKFKICRQVLHWLEIEPDFTDWTSYPVWMWGFGPAPEDFIYGFPSLDGKTVKMASESFVDSSHPDYLSREVSADEQDLFWKEKVSGKILGLKPTVSKSVVCFYTVTEDARFVIRPMVEMENVLLVSACSGHGFKHSAALGEQLAKALSEGMEL
ncbi:MAG: N-methyl-L-tryptophan oxidase [Algoriphagus sp.]|uniref:N-methyl-L-tryptophan oxidase n=1 Tax=Algoriphagus sp. TaxID=1872435 RepID=UPI00273011E2|nr:N-methyl-L-tryptophan oxidase [Algoriphagus sp.]MDP2040584.1 N-methyl-L-tryptophan oxidase [Algoriphagus sp.]MDP3473334.1 N-methyl-L-tryptophan oxidase [Algoriphagus sp.]